MTDVALRSSSSGSWLEAVLADFDTFLLDHAANERKASASAMVLVVRYPDRDALLDPMIRLAREELAHFHRVYRILAERGVRFHSDTKDPYVNRLREEVRRDKELGFLDRLVLSAVVEARGHERFGRIAESLPAGPLKLFYEDITVSEHRHAALFLDLAHRYFDAVQVVERLHALLDLEAEILAALPIRAALH